MRGRHAAVAAIGLAAGGIAAWLSLTSDHLDSALAATALSLVLGWSFIGSGLVAWIRRPGNRVGPLMVGIGMAWFLGQGGLFWANGSVAFTLGALLEPLVLVMFAQLLLAFPSGRCASRAATAVVVLAYVDVTVFQLLHLFFAPTVCDGCPSNELLIEPNADVANGINTFQVAFGALLSLVGIGIVVTRLRGATPPMRRTMGPVLRVGGVAFAALIVSLVNEGLGEPLGDVPNWIVILVFAVVPFAFLIGLLHHRLARTAVGRLVVELSGPQAPTRTRDAIARALGDPSVELAYWLPEEAEFVDSAGARVELPVADSGRTATPVEQDGRRIGALVHDASLEDQQELVDGVCAAAALALENERLQAELRAKLAELRRERDFISSLVDSAPVLVIVIDRDGRLLRFNRACEQLTGMSAAEVEGTTVWREFVPADERSDVLATVDGVFSGDFPNMNENHWLTKDGERRLILWSNNVLRGEDGEVEAVVSAGIDISERKRMENELRASRSRIVEAGDAERRRLERNLHDGAQQRLVALSLALRLTQAKIEPDPAGAEAMLFEASEELAQALGELRELARGIHPAVLTDRGLEAALETLAGRAKLDVDLRIALEEPLPEPVEAAAYYVVAEALTNVGRYAQASSVSVSVRQENGRAFVEVADDGVGGADPSAGSGLRGLVDRVEALEGTLRVDSAAGQGTRLRAEIPLS